ncbi:IcmT/TraK family protein [Cereibacter sphaeroides]|uniref:IcmT/TraK family protein n=1 Tax=Cereibacter sphaeroides TaxID=1063 RepID=UPI001F1EF371|nr:IcmT/TraK family protein [Cereibacter sphaeroides]MCE6959683.1 IcmT/TraK family protein [Cereibacter sphaeroides]MCE6974456.1 IcmT/TraK family protein [Cereibacter sphaeroides]
MSLFGTPLYWRETHRQPRFLLFDGRITILLLLMVMHIRIWTIALTVIAIAILWWFGRKGVSPDSILRFLRARIVGRRRTARGLAAERPAVDHGYETAAHVLAMTRTIEQRRLAHEASMKKGRRS